MTVAQRIDDVKQYPVNLFATTPIHIEDVNLMVINYDKRADVLSDHTMALNTRIADNIAYAWGPTVATQQIQTTGSARPASVTGGADKKAVTYADILALGELFDSQDIPEEGRYILASAQMYKDLKAITEFISVDFANVKPSVSGQIGEINGFKVFKRSRTLLYDDAFAKKALGDASAITDRDALLAWHSSFVRRAEGNVKVYADTDKPEYLGSIYNAAVRNGGMIGRLDQKGVAVLIQATA